ncbi:MAG: ATP-binding protein [Kofleriaceae bacterium]
MSAARVDPGSELSSQVTAVARALLARALVIQAARRPPGRASAQAVAAAEVARLLLASPTADVAEFQAAVTAHDRAERGVLDELDRWIAADAGPLARLRDGLALTAEDVALLAVLVAPELDPELERAYAFALDDFTRKRPDVGLLVRLVGGADPEVAARVRARLAWDAPLRRHRLVVVAAGDELAPASHRTVRITDRTLAHLLGDERVDERVALVARPSTPPSTPLVLAPALVTATERALAAPRARLLLAGKPGTGRASLVEAWAAAHGRAAMRIDLAALGEAGAMNPELLALALREVVLRDAVAILEGDELPAELPRRSISVLTDAFDELPGPAVLVLPTRVGWLASPHRDLVELEVPAPSFTQRAQLWRQRLPAAIGDDTVEALASRYAFTAASIAATAHRATAAARVRGADAEIAADEIADAARLQFGSRLGTVAQRIPTGFAWSDLVLPADTTRALREFLTFARRRAFLLEEWGFAAKLPYGRGVSAILAGPPGTGKTMVAQLLAKELGYDLYRVDLSQIVNKYIGETEKNLARIFEEAETSHAVLFFDEADALFAKRTEVRSSNDRYANLEVNYLLQRMETFDGVTLLATNLEQGLDEAFKRRVRFSIQFEVPEADERRRLWQSMFPPQTPLAPDVDWDRLAKTFEMAGGYIKKAAVRAAMLAADAQPRRAITTADLLEAGRHEYREMGRIVAG